MAIFHNCQTSEIETKHLTYLQSLAHFKKVKLTAKTQNFLFEDLANLMPDYFSDKENIHKKSCAAISKMYQQSFFDQAILGLKAYDKDLYRFQNIINKVNLLTQLNHYTPGNEKDYLGFGNKEVTKDFTHEDFQELCLHQLAHGLLHIEEESQHFLKDHLKQTFIETDFVNRRGGNSFEVQIFFHSLMVGVEILIFRCLYRSYDYSNAVHGSNQKILRRSMDAHRILVSKYQFLFSSRGSQILEQMENELNRINEYWGAYASR